MFFSKKRLLDSEEKINVRWRMATMNDILLIELANRPRKSLFHNFRTYRLLPRLHMVIQHVEKSSNYKEVIALKHLIEIERTD